MDDVIRRAQELTVSLVDPAPTSGNLVQRVYFQWLGMTPERNFKKVLYAST